MSTGTFQKIPEIFILISILDQNSYGISPCSRSVESPTFQETMILRNASRVVEKGSSLLYNLKCCSSVWSKILSGGRQKRELLPHDLSAGWQPNVCSKQTSWMQSRFPYLKFFFTQNFKISHRVKRWEIKETVEHRDSPATPCVCLHIHMKRLHTKLF